MAFQVDLNGVFRWIGMTFLGESGWRFQMDPEDVSGCRFQIDLDGDPDDGKPGSIVGEVSKYSKYLFLANVGIIYRITVTRFLGFFLSMKLKDCKIRLPRDIREIGDSAKTNLLAKPLQPIYQGPVRFMEKSCQKIS